MKNAVQVLLLGIMINCLLAGLAHATGSWRPISNERGIQLFQRTVPGKVYQENRVNMVIKGTVAGIAAILNDASLCTKWVSDCRFSKVVQRLNTAERINHTVIDAPLLYEDREMYFHSSARYQSAHKTLVISMMGQDDFGPAHEQRVRVKSIRGTWRLQQVNDLQVRVDYQMYSDPQVMPAIIVDTFISESLFKTMDKLRSLAASAKYKTMQFDAEQLRVLTR